MIAIQIKGAKFQRRKTWVLQFVLVAIIALTVFNDTKSRCTKENIPYHVKSFKKSVYLYIIVILKGSGNISPLFLALLLVFWTWSTILCCEQYKMSAL